MAKQHAISSITALPPSPHDDRRSRMIKYLIAMSIRLVCILLCLVVEGWWLLVFVVGAVVLPYFAVVLANVGAQSGGIVQRPGTLVRSGADGQQTTASSERDEPSESGDQK